jgi:hypothetical protein
MLATQVVVSLGRADCVNRTIPTLNWSQTPTRSSCWVTTIPTSITPGMVTVWLISRDKSTPCSQLGRVAQSTRFSRGRNAETCNPGTSPCWTPQSLPTGLPSLRATCRYSSRGQRTKAVCSCTVAIDWCGTSSGPADSGEWSLPSPPTVARRCKILCGLYRIRWHDARSRGDLQLAQAKIRTGPASYILLARRSGWWIAQTVRS